VKAAERSWIVLRDGDNGVGRYFGIAGAGTVGSALTGAPTTSTIEALANGWYRCTITYTSTGTFSAPIIYLATGDGAADFSGDGASGLYLWGAQLEAGAFATSYIPTTTVAVARAADAVTLGTVGAWFNQTTGAMYSQHILPAISPVNDQYSAAFSAGVATTDVVGLRAANTTATAGLIVASGNVVQSSCDTSSTPTSLTKQAGAWAANDFVDVVGGGTPSTDSSGSIPSGIDRLNIGNHGNTIHLLNGYLRRVAYWNSRLSNAALQALTT
jgi:hypothetical protein